MIHSIFKQTSKEVVHNNTILANKKCQDYNLSITRRALSVIVTIQQNEKSIMKMRRPNNQIESSLLVQD